MKCNNDKHRLAAVRMGGVVSEWFDVYGSLQVLGAFDLAAGRHV